VGALNFRRVTALAAELTATLATMRRIDACLLTHGAAIDSPAGTGVYCVCAAVIGSNIGMLKVGFITVFSCN
jgi:hypothetical protein